MTATAPAQDTQNRTARVLAIATARPTFVVAEAKARADRARALLSELGADVIGPSELVMDADGVEEARSYLAEDFDVVINLCASFSDANPAIELYSDLDQPIVTWSFREPGPVGDPLWLNSLCGSNLIAHALTRSGGDVRLVYGDPEEDDVRRTLSELLEGRYPKRPELTRRQESRADADAVVRSLEGLQGATIGVIGEAPPGFTPSQFDPQLLKHLFGIEVDQRSTQATFDGIDNVEEGAVHGELDSLATDRPSLADLDQTVVAKHAAVTTSFRDWVGASSLSAIAVRCWPEFPIERGVCPCSSLSRLADEGTPTVCERDVYGAVTMLLMEALGSGTTYLVDTVDLDTEANVVRLWHCGAAATSLAADPDQATQSTHCNRKIGVAGNFALKTGPVIVARLTEDNDGEGTSGLRLLLGSGESLPAENRFQGNTADVRLDTDARSFIHALVAEGFPHHTVLAWNDVRPELRAAADQLGIPVVEW